MIFAASTLWSFLILLVIAEGLVAENTCPSSAYPPVPGPPGRDGRDGQNGKDGRDGKDCSQGTLSYEDYLKLRQSIIDDVISERLITIVREEVASALNKSEEPTIPVFQDCSDALNNNYTQSGVYTIQPDSFPPFDVYCDMDTDGGGWIVFQRRQDGSVSFYRNWVTYANGFGNLSNEFWLGLEYIRRLTNGGYTELRVDMADWEGETAYAKYSSFEVSDACTNYTLTVSGFTGNGGDSLATSQQINQAFSTYDVDNDNAGQNCAESFKGAWWYNACHHSNLNGLYHGGSHNSFADGVNWYTWKGYNYSLKFTEMKVRAPG